MSYIAGNNSTGRHRHRIDTDVNIVLSNSFGFGGTNSAIVMKKVK